MENLLFLGVPILKHIRVPSHCLISNPSEFGPGIKMLIRPKHLLKSYNDISDTNLHVASG